VNLLLHPDLKFEVFIVSFNSSRLFKLVDIAFHLSFRNLGENCNVDTKMALKTIFGSSIFANFAVIILVSHAGVF